MGGKWPPIEKRLWAKVDKSGECWIWKGSTASGYGQIQYKGKQTRVHRLVWELEHGEIPEGMDICHNCPGGDNPLCCNRAHLFMATHAENIQDRQRKGRTKGAVTFKGQAKWNTQLTDEDVLQIRQLSKQGMKQKHIAEIFGVTPPAISLIVNRINWRHI